MSKPIKRKIRVQDTNNSQELVHTFSYKPRKIRSQLSYTEVEQPYTSSEYNATKDNSSYVFHKNNNYSIKVKHSRISGFHRLFVFLRWYFFFFQILLEEEIVDEDTFLLGDIEIPFTNYIDDIYNSSDVEKIDFLKNLMRNFFDGQQLLMAEWLAELYVKNDMDFLVEYTLLNEVIGFRVTFNKKPILNCLDRLADVYCDFIKKYSKVDEKDRTQGFREMKRSIHTVFAFIIDICVCGNNIEKIFDFNEKCVKTPFEFLLWYIHDFAFERKNHNSRLDDTNFGNIRAKFNQINTNPILEDFMTYYMLRTDFYRNRSDDEAKRYVNAVSRLEHLPYLLRAKSSTVIRYTSDGRRSYIQSDIKLPVALNFSNDLSLIELYLHYKAKHFEDDTLFRGSKGAFNYSKKFDNFRHYYLLDYK